MAAVDVVWAPASVPVDVPIFPAVPDPVRRPILSRKRRMNFFDLANLLDSDGNLQNEMLVFAFAATMLSTIPVLLGNEFDVNVGLKRKRRDVPEEDDDPGESSYLYYMSAEDSAPAFFSNYTYKKIMTTPKGTKEFFHMHNGSSTSPDGTPVFPFQNGAVANEALSELVHDLLVWSKDKIKNKALLPMLVNLAIDRYHGYSNPADKLVKAAYKKWKNFW